MAKLASVAFYVIMARKLGEGGFGDFTFALSLTTVLIFASGFGTEALIAREVARDRSRIHSYLGNVVVLKVMTSALLLAVAVAIVNLAGYPAETRVAVYLIGFGVAIENLSRTWHSAFQAYERMEFISATIILQRATTAAVGIAVLMAGGGLIAVSLVFMGGAIVGLAANGWALRRFVVVPRRELDRSQWLPLIKAGMPIGLAGLTFVILLRVDASLLSFLKGGSDNSEVGLYGAAFRLVETTMFLSWALGTAMLPWLAIQRNGSGISLARGYELALKLLTALMVPIGLAFVLLAAPLIDLFYGEGYDEAVLPLQLLGAMTVLFGVNFLASTVLIARDRPGYFTRVASAVAVQNVALNLVLIPAYGAAGAAFTATSSGILLAVLSTRQVTSVVGAIRPVRVFAGPLVGGGAMAAAILLSAVSLVPAAVLGSMAYLVVLLAFERSVFRDDVGLLVEMLRRRERVPPQVSAARPKPDPPGIGFEA